MENFTDSDKLIIKRALSYYAQIYFDKGIFINENNCVDIKDDCYEIVQKCDEIIDKLN